MKIDEALLIQVEFKSKGDVCHALCGQIACYQQTVLALNVMVERNAPKEQIKVVEWNATQFENNLRKFVHTGTFTQTNDLDLKDYYWFKKSW